MTDRFSKDGLIFDDLLLISGHSQAVPHDVFIAKSAPNYQVI
jgi:IMP dehydrogenase/GMP reductase